MNFGLQSSNRYESPEAACQPSIFHRYFTQETVEWCLRAPARRLSRRSELTKSTDFVRRSRCAAQNEGDCLQLKALWQARVELDRRTKPLYQDEGAFRELQMEY